MKLSHINKDPGLVYGTQHQSSMQFSAPEINLGARNYSPSPPPNKEPNNAHSPTHAQLLFIEAMQQCLGIKKKSTRNFQHLCFGRVRTQPTYSDSCTTWPLPKHKQSNLCKRHKDGGWGE